MLISINPLITLAVFVPLMAVLVMVNTASKRIQQYRKANQEAIGEVTGLLGEVFGAVQAVKVAGAEEHVVAHFRRRQRGAPQGGPQRRAAHPAAGLDLFNAANLGTGLMLLLAAQAHASGQLHGGRFRPLRLLPRLADGRDQHVRQLPRQVPPGAVSLQRAIELLQGAPPETLVQYNPVHLRGPTAG